MVFIDMTPYSLVSAFGETCCILLQGLIFLRILKPKSMLWSPKITTQPLGLFPHLTAVKFISENTFLTSQAKALTTKNAYK
jgi:hypothetical protein